MWLGFSHLLFHELNICFVFTMMMVQYTVYSKVKILGYIHIALKKLLYISTMINVKICTYVALPLLEHCLNNYKGTCREAVNVRISKYNRIWVHALHCNPAFHCGLKHANFPFSTVIFGQQTQKRKIICHKRLESNQK